MSTPTGLQKRAEEDLKLLKNIFNPDEQSEAGGSETSGA